MLARGPAFLLQGTWAILSAAQNWTTATVMLVLLATADVPDFLQPMGPRLRSTLPVAALRSIASLALAQVRWLRRYSAYAQEIYGLSLRPDFKYDPLRSTTIRLLSLVPGNWDSPIQCTLKTVSLDDQPVFIAASYTWSSHRIWPGFVSTVLLVVLFTCSFVLFLIKGAFGTGIPAPQTSESLASPSWYEFRSWYDYATRDRRHWIALNGQRFEVRENLYELLRELRREGGHSCYWIDAICVDQKNVPERDAHVAIMGRIYTDAVSVIAWLGPCATRLDRRSRMGAVHLPLRSSEDELHRLRDGGFTSFADHTYRSWARVDLLRRPYFRRTWIIQELLLPTHLLFAAGQYRFSANDMRQVIRLANHDLIRVLCWSLSDPVALALQALDARDHFRRTRRLSLAQYLNCIRGREVTDLRDLVYAGLGLLPDANPVAKLRVVDESSKNARNLLRNPSYDATFASVLRACGIQLLQNEGMNALSLARSGTYPGPGSEPRLPSWLPHITRRDSLLFDAIMRHSFVAGGPCRTEITIDSRDHLLLENGALSLGSLNLIVPVSSTSGLVSMVCAINSDKAIYTYSEQPYIEAIARTCIADTINGERVSDLSVAGELIRSMTFDLQDNQDKAQTFQNEYNINYPFLPPQVRAFISQESFYQDQMTERNILIKRLMQVSAALPEEEHLRSINDVDAGSHSTPEERAIHDDDYDRNHRTGTSERSTVNLTGSSLPNVRQVDRMSTTESEISNPVVSRALTMLTFGVETGRQLTSYEEALKVRLGERVLFQTSLGFLGIGSKDLQKGDSIMILAGASMPFAMKLVDEGAEPPVYEMRGEVYVHGVMDGEFVKDKEEEFSSIQIR